MANAALLDQPTLLQHNPRKRLVRRAVHLLAQYRAAHPDVQIVIRDDATPARIQRLVQDGGFCRIKRISQN